MQLLQENHSRVMHKPDWKLSWFKCRNRWRLHKIMPRTHTLTQYGKTKVAIKMKENHSKMVNCFVDMHTLD